LTTRIRRLQRSWERFGRVDPLWAIVTWPGKKGNKWDPEEFFQTGEAEITAALKHATSLGLTLRWHRALDFGCGVGRLTQTLAEHFDEVTGVDIAPSMLELAERYNRHGKKCRYVLNETDNLRAFPDASFDFIYTGNTLQHMEPRFAKSYLKEFLRVLSPEGVCLFQIPGRLRPSPPAPPHDAGETMKERIKHVTPGAILRLYRLLRYGRISRTGPTKMRADGAVMEMYGIARGEVVGLVLESGGEVVDVSENQMAGPRCESYLYCAVKRKVRGEP